MADTFKRFTERARLVLTLAQEEARRFNHNYIGTEHLLLALVREGDGVAARVLTNLGVQLPKVRSAVEFIIGHGVGEVVGEIGLTPRAKNVIELAVAEARRLAHYDIGTEHLLLGMVREGEGIAAGVLESMGVSLALVRDQVMQIIDQSGGYGSMPGPAGKPTLRELRRVLPVAQTERAAGVEVTVLSLETYADGFLVNLRLLPLEGEPSAARYLPILAVEANDDRGGRYEGEARGVPWADRRQWRLSYAFQPALDPTAQSLNLRFPQAQWLSSLGQGSETLTGPWAFTIALA
jgi:hypothetical protein